MSKLATLTMGVAVAFAPAMIQAQTTPSSGSSKTVPPGATQSTKDKPNANGYNGSQTGVTTGVGTVGSADSQATPVDSKAGNGSNNGVTNGAPPAANNSGYNGSLTGVTDGAGTISGAGYDNSQNDAVRGAATPQDRSATAGRSSIPAVGATDPANRSMPNTAGDWLGMLLSGTMLSGAGLALRRFRR